MHLAPESDQPGCGHAHSVIGCLQCRLNVEAIMACNANALSEQIRRKFGVTVDDKLNTVEQQLEALQLKHHARLNCLSSRHSSQKFISQTLDEDCDSITYIITLYILHTSSTNYAVHKRSNITPFMIGIDFSGVALESTGRHACNRKKKEKKRNTRTSSPHH